MNCLFLFFASGKELAVSQREIRFPNELKSHKAPAISWAQHGSSCEGRGRTKAPLGGQQAPLRALLAALAAHSGEAPAPAPGSVSRGRSDVNLHQGGEHNPHCLVPKGIFLLAIKCTKISQNMLSFPPMSEFKNQECQKASMKII